MTHTTLASSYAAAVKKDEDMAALAMTSSERIDALEKRVAKLEAALTNPKALWNAAAAAPGGLPAAPATNPDPTA
jgi:hypothetical protein